MTAASEATTNSRDADAIGFTHLFLVRPLRDPNDERKYVGAMAKVRVLLAALLLPLIILTGVATAILWPDDNTYETPESAGIAAEPANGTVTEVRSGPCENDITPGAICDTVSFVVTSGPGEGDTGSTPANRGPGVPEFEVGDKIVLGRVTTDGATTYYISDYQRKSALGWLGAAFALLVVLIGRWRGIGALIGLVFTWAVVTKFLLPSLLEGNSPVYLAITASALIVFVVLYVAHGFNARTTTALIGTLFGLVLTAVLASFAVSFANITGFASEDVTSLQNYVGQIDVHGLLLAGIVIGALGVLNDVTITQTSAVWEVRDANPTLSRYALYKSGMRVGRDHLASTVYTLILAYVGAALPLLVLFAGFNREWSEVVGTDLVGEEIVRTIAGSIGLMLAVPITTALAAFVAGAKPSESESGRVVDLAPELPDAEHSRVDELVPAGAADQVATITGEPSAASGEHFVDGGIEEIHTDNETIAAEPEENGQINPEAYPPAPAKRRFGLPRRDSSFNRKMSRREKKFWKED
jgi:uncharacterized membrane protein